jgi:hypothetical protein
VWVRPRSARWKAWLWAFASPGRTRPAGARPRPAGAPGVVGVASGRPSAGRPTIRPSATSTSTSVRGGRRAARRARSGRRSGRSRVRLPGRRGRGGGPPPGPRARRPGRRRRRGSRPPRRAPRARGRPRWGCGRTASPSGCRRAPSTPASCPAPVASTGTSAHRRVASVRGWLPERRVEVHPRRPGLLDRGDPGDLGDLGHDGADGGLVVGAGVQPGPHPVGDRVDRVRLDPHPSHGRDPAAARAVASAASTTAAWRSIGIVAVLHPRGAGVVGPTGQLEPPAPVGPDRAADADRPRRGRPAPALLDVQLDERADAPDHLGSGRSRRVATGPHAAPPRASRRRRRSAPGPGRARAGRSAPASRRRPPRSGRPPRRRRPPPRPAGPA